MYYIYHILGKKVGMTKNIEKRVEDEQGCRSDEYEIVEEVKLLKDALKAEQKWNNKYGYKDTPEWHPDLKNMKDTYKYNSGVSVTLDHDYKDQEKLTFIDEDGTNYVFTDTSLIPTQMGRYPEGNPKPFAYWKAVRNAYQQQEELVSKKQFNECADLVIEEVDADINTCFELQLELQKKFPETENIGDQTIAETAVSAQRNMHAFMDEVMEFMDAMGGMHDGYKNGAWKYWKQDYKKAKEDKISDLSPRDLQELKFEYVDMLSLIHI